MKLLFTLLLALLLIFCSPPTGNDNAKRSSDNLNELQKDVLKYFWDYAHPISNLSRERLHVSDLIYDYNRVTIGGSGFGILNILMGIENDFIDKDEAVEHLEVALDFLEKADRFHGAWPHWINGSTGSVIPFSDLDDGGDLVETAFLVQALICIREYFKDGNAREIELAEKADKLWKGVEWDWYTNEQDVLYWHWSPNYQWAINLPITGYNEALITYILAAASPTYSISHEVYHQGWANSGGIKTEEEVYDIPILLKHGGTNGHVGPLFFSHYSNLVLDPRGLSDQYVENYWNVVKNHTEIVYQHCVENPKNYEGYSESVWGLTASYTRNSDGTTGYSVHDPNNDKGVITPTAALSSFPYTPEKSAKFLDYLYDNSNGEYLGLAGPYDAFSIHFKWKAERYLAIDQGTIGPMIENHKTQLFWNLFMNAPDIQDGLKKLGFSSSEYGFY